MAFTPSIESFNGYLMVDNPKDETDDPRMDMGALPVLSLVALSTFVIQPLVVKAFAPEWSYGRRLGVAIGLNMAVSAARSVTQQSAA